MQGRCAARKPAGRTALALAVPWTLGGCLAGAAAGIAVRLETLVNPVTADELEVRVVVTGSTAVRGGELRLDGCTALTFTGAPPPVVRVPLGHLADGEHRVAVVVWTPLGGVQAEVRFELRRGAVPGSLLAAGCA